jgi:hypothetical protein
VGGAKGAEVRSLRGLECAEAVGFASFGPFPASPGYRFTVEHPVHGRTDRRWAGVGPALMHAEGPVGDFRVLA